LVLLQYRFDLGGHEGDFLPDRRWGAFIFDCDGQVVLLNELSKSTLSGLRCATLVLVEPAEKFAEPRVYGGRYLRVSAPLQLGDDHSKAVFEGLGVF